MDALILFSHGSVLEGAGRTLFEHAERLRAATEFSSVEVGFMNYSQPTFAEAVARCAEAGARRIIVTPYFLVPGRFVSVDMPRHIDEARHLWPMIEFVVAEPIGFDARLADAMLNLAAVGVGPGTTALLAMVHGSPLESANEVMYRVLDVVRDRGECPIVEAGFLECNEPSIPAAIDSCVNQRAQRIIAVPYFLHTGNHVMEDLPALIHQAQERYHDVEMVMTDFLGSSPRITEVLAHRAISAL